MEVNVVTVIVAVVSAISGVAAALITKRVRTQDKLDEIVENRISQHIKRIDGENEALRSRNLQLGHRLATVEHDHFRIKQLELSVRMLSDALGRIDPSNPTLAMVRILFATMYDVREAPPTITEEKQK